MKRFLKMDDIELVFEKEALKAVAKKAVSLGTGARGLRTIIERAMLNIMYELPSIGHPCKCIISKDHIRKQTSGNS